MTQIPSEPTILPALRGMMGSWVYYSCLMQLSEVSSRVQFADEVHTHHRLSEMIQRSIDESRIKEIADYLRLQPQRFFSSLVVAVYDGEPNWHALVNVRNRSSDPILDDLQTETIASVGFLTLRGDEKLFALDGQHRLAGINATIEGGFQPALDDEISVIFVAHEQSSVGRERTRRLFTTLNKEGRQVSKGDRIALDEDDVMAICVRRLIEQSGMFNGDRIAYNATNNVPPTNTESLTTIGNLYDLLAILFTDSSFPLRMRRRTLETRRPSNNELDQYFNYAKEYFTHLRSHFYELEEFFSAERTSDVVQRYRGRHGGSALYRPIGLEVFTRIITRLTEELSLDEAVQRAAELPRDLQEPPYSGLMWDPNSETIISRGSNRVALREILCHMIDTNLSKYSTADLLQRYRRLTGDLNATLPNGLR